MSNFIESLYLDFVEHNIMIGTWLLFWPCGWSLCLATPGGQLPDPKLLLTFALGALVMRGAGCTINDMWDRKIDSLVQRTRDRPLASGQVIYIKAYYFTV